MRRLGLPLAALVALAALAPANAEAVIGGEPLAEGEAPWQVEIATGFSPTVGPVRWCGGALVAPDRVLTSARCALGLDPRGLEVVAGRRHLSSPRAQRVAVAGLSVPGARGNSATSNDAALVLLGEPITTAEPIAPLGEEEDELAAPGVEGLVTGWGSLHRDVEVLPDDLRGTSQVLRSDSQCRSALGIAFSAAAMTCAEGGTAERPDGTRETAGPCERDTGTALAVPARDEADLADSDDWRLAGLANPLTGLCGRVGLPFAYVDPALFRELATEPDPPIQPYATADPRLLGVARVNSTLACEPATFEGEVESALTLFELRSADDTALAVGDTYTPGLRDIGSRITCVTRASGPGGFFEARSRGIEIVPAVTSPAAPAPPEDQPASELPAVAPPPSVPDVLERLRADGRPPVAAIASRRCSARRCRLVIRAEDDLPDNVAAVLVRWRAKGGRRRAARARRYGQAWAVRSADGRWRALLGPLPRGSIELLAVALDRGGNRSRRARAVVRIR